MSLIKLLKKERRMLERREELIEKRILYDEGLTMEELGELNDNIYEVRKLRKKIIKEMYADYSERLERGD
jgi:hypothetical protein